MSEGYTRFTKLEAEALKLSGGVVSATQISKAADYALTDAEKRLYIGVTLTVASKTLTLGLAAGQVAFVCNEGATNAVTVKNVAGDAGTSLAAGKALLIVGSETADATVVVALN